MPLIISIRLGKFAAIEDELLWQVRYFVKSATLKVMAVVVEYVLMTCGMHCVLQRNTLT